MHMLGTIDRVIRLGIALMLLGWFAWGAYITSEMRNGNISDSDAKPRERVQTFAPERPRYDHYEYSDPYTAPMDDTTPTVQDW